MGYDVAHAFLAKLEDMVEFLLPNYVAEGKNQLVIAIGCTGGHHRSVTLAEQLYVYLKGQRNMVCGSSIAYPKLALHQQKERRGGTCHFRRGKGGAFQTGIRRRGTAV